MGHLLSIPIILSLGEFYINNILQYVTFKMGVFIGHNALRSIQAVACINLCLPVGYKHFLEFHFDFTYIVFEYISLQRHLVVALGITFVHT